MQWYIVFVILFVFVLLIPIRMCSLVKFNLLKINAEMEIKLFIFKIKSKIYVKKGYIYMTTKKRTIKEKISLENPNLKFVDRLIKNIYFRQVFIALNVNGEIGYINDAFVGAMMANFTDILFKSIFAPIKNNKKCAHIFVDIVPNYSKDSFSLKLYNESSMSLYDLIYSFIIAKFMVKGNKNGRKQNRIAD